MCYWSPSTNVHGFGEWQPNQQSLLTYKRTRSPWPALQTRWWFIGSISGLLTYSFSPGGNGAPFREQKQAPHIWFLMETMISAAWRWRSDVNHCYWGYLGFLFWHVHDVYEDTFIRYFMLSSLLMWCLLQKQGHACDPKFIPAQSSCKQYMYIKLALFLSWISAYCNLFVIHCIRSEIVFQNVHCYNQSWWSL